MAEETSAAFRGECQADAASEETAIAEILTFQFIVFIAICGYGAIENVSEPKVET